MRRLNNMTLPLAALLVSFAAAQTAAGEASPQQPAPMAVSDPMLAPMEPAPKQVERWDEALKLVKERSTTLRSAQAGVERAQGRWKQALSALFPTARFTANATLNLLNPTQPPFVVGIPQGSGVTGTVPLGTASVNLTQTVLDLSAWRGLSSAEASEASAEASLDDMQRRLTLGLARSLVAVVAAERAAELNRLGLRQALERAQLTARTFELGAGTQLDVSRVDQDVEVAREALISGDEQLRRTREALGLALGFDHAVGVSPAFDLRGLVDETRQSCAAIEKTLDRPDLIAQQKQLESAAESTRQASAGYLPTLGLTSNVSAFTTSPGPGTIPFWNIAAVLSVPIWEGGLREGLVRERRGAEQQAAESLEGTRRDVEVEIARARRSVEVAEALVRATAAARDLAQKTDLLTRRSFEVGRGTSLELVQSAAVLRRAELALALREFELVQARLDAFLIEARCDW